MSAAAVKLPALKRCRAGAAAVCVSGGFSPATGSVSSAAVFSFWDSPPAGGASPRRVRAEPDQK